MNRHQVLTGACNNGERCHAIGSVEGIHFTAYAAGCDIVILASDFQRVQIIPGVTHGNVRVSCIDCATDSGKIAASYQKKVYVFEPAPLLNHDTTHKLDYHWYQTAVFEAECVVNCLTWTLEGTRLLTAGDVIQIWGQTHDPNEDHGGGRKVMFMVGHQEGQDNAPEDNDAGARVVWEPIWRCKPATPIQYLQFSPDGLLFASAGKDDRLVKIWYEDRKIQLPLSHADSIVSPKRDPLHYSFIYIAHPRAVTGFSWRRTSKYMPRGSVANMLITSCRDNVCRIWCETILPDDGLVDLEQCDPNSSFDPKFHTHRHKKRFMQRLKTIRHAIHKRRRHKLGPEVMMSVPEMSNVMSVHDFHKFAIHQNGVAPALHFHLSASINPETDIPLLPTVSGKNHEHDFQLHWLNNKELQFTMESEKILHELHKGTLDEHDHEHHRYYNSHSDSDTDSCSEMPDRNHDGHHKKKKRSFKNRHSRTNGHFTGIRSNNASFASINSEHSDIGSSEGSRPMSPDMQGTLVDMLDRKIENLLKDWHQHCDMLFSIHPVDGSFLVWLVDWLDEFTPYSFRQAQVSFSSRLPRAFPIPDARTMTSSLLLYCNYSKMDIKSVMKMCEHDYNTEHRGHQSAAASGKGSPGQNDNMLIPNVLMISKHLNGSLNQWQISFSENSQFTTVVSVAHASRACGHRFRTSSAVCHPALPLLITTSQHNVPTETREDGEHGGETTPEDTAVNSGIQFCSELILWRVDPVGPLSKSGGLVELARVNTPQVSAFCNIAWVPTLLPSTILGPYSNSPSTLFVASDGECLRLYQAVNDARSLLMEVNTRKDFMSFSSATSSGYSADAQEPAAELFSIISEQSSARPGCIIELDALTDGQQTWQEVQLLHVFQEQLVTGKSSSKGDNSGMEPIVDLRNMGSFEENFFIVLLEKSKRGGSILHMWKLTIASQLGTATEAPTDKNYCMDYGVVEDDDDSNPPSRGTSPEPELQSRPSALAKLVFSTTKVLSQKLPLPGDVEVVSAAVAAGHLSSASMFPACLAPYLLVTACSDGEVRFWQCDQSPIEGPVSQSCPGLHQQLSYKTRSFQFGVEEEDGVRRQMRRSSIVNTLPDTLYTWLEWTPLYEDDQTSSIYIPGKPITVSCAYTGRIAVAYRSGAARSCAINPENLFVNLCVAIFECESTGGSEWVREDTIELKNIRLPQHHAEVDLHATTDRHSLSETESPQTLSPATSFLNMSRTKSVPSMSAICSARKELENHDDQLSIMRPTHLVQLDWVSTEDGSHILTVGVGSKVMMYAQVSNDIIQESQKESDEKVQVNEPLHKVPLKDPTAGRRAMLQKSKSMVVDNYQEELQWMKLRCVELSTADGLPPLPMHMSWVRGGIMVIGMDNEMHVYSQWRFSQGNNDYVNFPQMEDNDIRSFEEMKLVSVELNRNKSVAGFTPSYSMPNFKKMASQVFKKEFPKSSPNLKKTLERSESSLSLTVIHELGLFEAARQSSPVLPQYHPKSLMELLNFGKVKRVKAILAHLVRCIAGREATRAMYVEDIETDDSRYLHRQRTISMAQSPGEAPILNEEPSLDYVEIKSIPPLPLYALLSADSDQGQAQADIVAHPGPMSPSEKTDYKDLFHSSTTEEDEVLDLNVLSPSERRPRSRTLSASAVNHNPNYFGSNQAQLLCKHLTHMHLPGLSGQDQMYLLALADTVAHTKTDFADSFEAAGTQPTSDHTNQPAESLDDCGLRFFLAMRHHMYLTQSLPPGQRAGLQRHGLKTFNLVWAFHSEATEELLSLIPSHHKGELKWMDLKVFGAGWWINNINILKRTIEKVAKAAFQAKKNPMDAALFYLAMKKKNVLSGLFRSVNDKRMSEFFRNDFSQDRWRKAALKNAYSLLGLQRFEHAAGFFLLAGSLKDAVEVCLHNMHDLQLALVICRLYEGEEMMSPSVKKILYSDILGCDETGDHYEPDKAHPDPFLRSMAYWLMKQYRSALQTLLNTDRGKSRAGHNDAETASTSNVFNFYNYLRTHPLLIRHRMVSAAPDLKHRSVIPGFTKQETIVGSPEDVVASFVDRVTPMERRLFFSTAHEHCKNGCPILALEVLSKLPVVINMEKDIEPETNASVTGSDACISTGRIPGGDQTTKVSGVSDTSMDWSKPVSSSSQQQTVDWSQPVITSSLDTADAMDWGQPTRNLDTNEELDLRISSSESEPDSDLDETVKERIPSIVVDKPDKGTDNESEDADNYNIDVVKTKAYHVDIFAQQYKFIACLKVMMEEMQTLATGFEVDGGQLRYQMYIWLEREVEALKWLCHYGDGDDLEEDQTVVSDGAFDDDEAWPTSPFQRRTSNRSRSGSFVCRPTLHEVILAEKMDFEAKLARMGRRKQWLRQNQQLLRTLVAYCVLQGAAGGGLASVQMELLLLLQELQQEKPQQQLLSPLPFPTTLPLLSASIASSKTVTSDPIQHLQCLSQDLLHSVIEFTSPPGLGAPLHTVLVMRNLSIALSACIYQTLCDSDSFVVSLNEDTNIGMEGFIDSQNFMCDASHLMAGVRRHRRRSFNDSEDIINTSPAKWPGVTSLRVLLAREKDEDAPKLSMLLTESLISVYVSLLINGLATYDCHMLYRLMAHRFDQQLWASLFGGGVKSILRLANQQNNPQRPGDDLHKQRMKLNMKIMGQGQGQGKKDHKTYKEKFVPPELSMITFFMTKPFIVNSEATFSYDSEESLSSEDEEGEDEDEDGDEISQPVRPTSLPISSIHEHSDPGSYSWCLVRYAMVKLARSRLANFLPQIGLEAQDLPVCSPLLHAVLRSMEQWEEVLLGKLELFAAPPDNYIPGVEVDIMPGAPITKYTSLLDKSNSPFINTHSTLPIKRLWFHLIRQDLLKNIFLRYVFRKPRLDHTDLEDSSIDGTDSNRITEPMKIIHKEQDIITAFAINQANHNCITLATQKELIELDITHILDPPQWLEDENEMDIECLNNPTPNNPMENVNFLVVHTPSDGPTNPPASGTTTPLTGLSSTASTPTVGLAPGQLAQTGRGSNLITRRVIPGVRRIGAHPSLPHYLTGSTDGSVRLWEWSHNQPLAVLRSPGNFPKVTKVLFNAQGNKCCVSDTEGQICLWQVGHGSNFNKPIMSLPCHNKTTSDFVFVGSSSLIATAGHSSENRNVCLWDTLLPQRSACVHAFICHEHGSPALVYAPHHQLLISSGRKGEICIFDIRQRQMRHTFQAHESPIRCLALDPEEEYFVTGSADGDIKVWGLSVHQLIVSFPGEHSRSSTFFRNMGSATGVTQVGIGPNHHLFSCGVDGSMKFRALPERESIVRFWAA